jgi:hypothetical protein
MARHWQARPAPTRSQRMMMIGPIRLRLWHLLLVLSSRIHHDWLGLSQQAEPAPSLDSSTSATGTPGPLRLLLVGDRLGIRRPVWSSALQDRASEPSPGIQALSPSSFVPLCQWVEEIFHAACSSHGSATVWFSIRSRALTRSSGLPVFLVPFLNLRHRSSS